MISPTTLSPRAVSNVTSHFGQAARPPESNLTSAHAPAAEKTPQGDASLREAFDTFVGETFYGTLLKSMRQTLDKPAYFHGGRAEEIFQGQLDQTLVEEMSKAGAQQFTGPMFELFTLSRT